jgi:predicted nucleic acid-binding protein
MKVDKSAGRGDVPFLQAATGGARYIISGDPHLLELNGKYPFPIVSLA